MRNLDSLLLKMPKPVTGKLLLERRIHSFFLYSNSLNIDRFFKIWSRVFVQVLQLWTGKTI